MGADHHEGRGAHQAGVREQDALELVLGLLRRTHLSSAGELPGVIAEQAAAIGAEDVRLYLIDYELATLVPVPVDGDDDRAPLSVSGTVAGRAYSSAAILVAPSEDDGRQRMWLPLLDGTERLGVIGMTFAGPPSDALRLVCERYAHIVAMLIVSKNAYSDGFEVVRRRQHMTIASELAQSLMPPRVLGTDGLTLAGLLEPAYDSGGDALDYALNGRLLHLAIFDAMGHGLAAAGVAAFALSAYRYSRRTGRDLLETYAAMDDAVGKQYPGSRFVTAIIARLDVDSGRLNWIRAGHPPPLLLRGARHARMLESAGTTPLGVPSVAPPVVAELSLEPGDQLLLYTDGLIEARGPDDRLLGIEGLSQFIEREAAAGQPAPETLRRLRQAVLGGGRAALRDDAAALLVEWRRGTEAAILPETVD